MAEEFEFEDIQPEEPQNRRFIIAAAALGGLVVISLIALALYTFFISPRQEQQQATNATQTAAAQTSAALAQIPTSTDTPLPTFTPTSTLPPTSTPTLAPETATVTPEATRGLILTPTPSGLPTAGFADEVGLTGLIFVALALLAIVIISRRVRLGMSD
jgi:hypothetical protein